MSLECIVVKIDDRDITRNNNKKRHFFFVRFLSIQVEAKKARLFCAHPTKRQKKN